eukprot:CAMPEP_0170237384 /NCGR_PEP_ID=MMETSP0116_2-20130129/18442_1 /TAXON_ID=400756 /ORGANISM="Durinskia baltica, Strain CSIRO CS-38" /LENGTH=363 /DNA_ID=CAMNT_0010488187 /DNA_START=100 /DNA_END=1189 /DNA_ORIENTATION=-
MAEAYPRFARRPLVLPLLLAAPVADAALLRTSNAAAVLSPDVLDTPDLTAYDPVEVLCAKGKDSNGNPNVQGWCKSWLACIKAGASPAGDAAAVRAAWKPADCREVCGSWPAVSAPEGSSLLASSARLRRFNATNAKDCETSCANFQESLTSCVATILFEPGKVAAMGIPGEGASAPPAHCTSKATGCMPDLPLRYQACLAKAEHSANECKVWKDRVEECKDCPQLSDNYLSHYHAFVGGCMDQLNSYWQATSPGAGASAIPGAAGCKVHERHRCPRPPDERAIVLETRMCWRRPRLRRRVHGPAQLVLAGDEPWRRRQRHPWGGRLQGALSATDAPAPRMSGRLSWRLECVGGGHAFVGGCM